MKANIIILILIFFIQNIGHSQTIIFSKDSLSIEGEGFYEDIKDSLFVKNSGTSELVIDSIYSKEIYLYPVEVFSKLTSYSFHISFDQNQYQSPIIISLQDSIKLIFYMPDLCPICYGASIFDFEDTLYFRSNALNDPMHLIYISGQGVLDTKDNFVSTNEYSLEQNFPNPFNPRTKIKYSINQPDFITLKVYDLMGKEIATLVNEEKTIGSYEINFDANNLSSGVYFYIMRAGNFIDTKKFILLK